MRASLALISVIAALSSLLAYGPASAQDVVPETPPELRNFRLDPQPERPAAQPTVEPAPVTPPPAVPTVPAANAPTPRRQAPAATPAPRPAAGEVDISAATEATTGDAVTVAPTVDPGPVAADEVISETPEQRPEATQSGLAWWQIGAALGLIAAMLAGLYRYMRSRKRAIQSEEPVVERAASLQPQKAAVPVKPALRPAPSTPKPTSRVAIDFVPEKATISFTALTIKGELRLINQSGQPAHDMQLRAGIISASAHQDAEIAAFHRQATQMPAKALGDAGAGERIGVAIELSVPLADLQSFPLGDQQLFVPLLVANIAYGGDGASEVAQLACMIGREANPPKPKMAPLRLDLGPRSFAPLGQRPVLS